MPIDITNQTRRVQYVGSGTGPYDFEFEVLEETDVAIYQDEELLVLTTDYSVTINSDGSGSVTTVATMTGSTVTIIGARPYERITDFSTGGDFRATTVNDELDSLQIQILQLLEKFDRTFKLADFTTFDGDLTLPSPGAGEFVRWNAAGTALETASLDDVGDSFLQSGTGAVSRSWTAKVGEWASVKDFAAVGDGSTDDSDAFTAALAIGGRIRVPAGTYRIDSAQVLISGTHLDMDADAVLDFSGMSDDTDFITATGTEAAALTLTGNATKYSRTITVADTSSLAVGDMLRLYSDEEFDPNRTASHCGEIVFVESLTATDITTDRDLCDDYATADSAKVAKITPVENIRVTGGKIKGDTTAASGEDGVIFYRAKNCQVRDVTFQDVDQLQVQLRDAVDCHVSHCRFTKATDTGTGYGVNVGDASQDCTVHHNYFERCRHAFTTGNATTYGGIPRRISFEDNTVLTSINSGDAIDTHAAAEEIFIRRNKVRGSASHGINIECPTATVEFNDIADTTSRGISHTNNTPRTDGVVRIVGNKIHNCGLGGIHVAQGVASDAVGFARVTVDMNEVSKCASGAAITVDGNSADPQLNVSVRGNVVDDATNANGAFVLVWLENFIFSGNRGKTNATAQAGARIENCKYGVVSGNQTFLISAATGSAYNIISTSAGDTTNVTITGNHVRSPSAASSKGVSVPANCRKLRIADNDFSDCTTTIATGTAYDVASGVITLVGDIGPITVDTEAAGATDDLDTINGGFIGQTLVISSASSARDTTLKDGTGNLLLAGDFALSNVADTITLYLTSAGWKEQCRSDNA